MCVFFNFICFLKKKASPAFVLIGEERGWVEADDGDISFTTRVVSQCPDPFIYLLFHYDKLKNSRCVNTDGKYFLQCYAGHRPMDDRSICVMIVVTFVVEVISK